MALTVTDKPEVVSLTGNPVFFELATDLVHPFLWIHLQLQVYIDSAWVDASGNEDKIGASVSRSAIFKIQGLLNKYLAPKFTYPENSDTLVINRPEMVVRFRIKYKESWVTIAGVQGESAWVTGAESFYAVKGGVPNELLAIYNTAQTTWWNEMVLNKQFCTWQPKEKRTYPGAVEKLYWIPRRTATESLRIVWTGVDGTTGTIIRSHSAVAYRMIEICNSPALVENLAGKPVASFNVYLNGQSEERIFTVSRRYFERADNFLYDNSLGCFDSLTAVGWRKETGSNERESYNKQFPLYPELTDRSIITHRAWRTDKNVSNTGFLLNTEWLQYLKEIDLSREAYCIEGTLPRAINVTTGESVTIDDSTDTHYYEVEWTFAHKNRYSGRFYGALRSPVPPYYSNVIAMFERRVGSKLIDRISGAEATIDGTGITFPVLGTDVFDKTNGTFWTGIPNTAGNNRKWLFAELSWEFMVDYATDAAHGTLFLKDFGDNIKSTLPILVYAPARTEAQQSEIVAYLETYSFLVDTDGSIIIDSDNAYVVDGTI